MFEKLGYIPIGNHLSLTGLDSAKSITVPPGANGVLLQAFTQNVRFTIGANGNPANVYFEVYAEQPPVLIPFAPGTKLTFIEAEASATASYLFVKA